MAKAPTIAEKTKKAFETMKGTYGYKNIMQAPKILKVVVSVGTGKLSKIDKKKNEFVAGRLAQIVGQKPVQTRAKQAVASFKTRQGDIIGQVATLRGKQMTGFLEKLLNVALPRAKDFRGISPRAVDGMGNCTIGIKEHSIFPEASDEDLRDVFGMAVTIVTNVKGQDEAREFLKIIGVPFRSVDEEKKVRARKKKEKRAPKPTA
jgi:large subunit ribosomal protein L5